MQLGLGNHNISQTYSLSARTYVRRTTVAFVLLCVQARSQGGLYAYCTPAVLHDEIIKIHVRPGQYWLHGCSNRTLLWQR